MCVILPPELLRFESVGLPLPSSEIKLLDVVYAVHLVSNTPPQGEVCTRGSSASILNGYYKLARKLNHRSFLSSWVPFPIFTSPRIIVALSTTPPHISVSATQSKITLEFTFMTLSPSESVLWLRKRKEKLSLLVLLPPINPVSERTPSRIFGQYYFHCQNYHRSDYVHRNSYGD